MPSRFSAYPFLLVVLAVVLLSADAALADDDLISLFPLDAYSQSVDTWLPPNSPNYDQSLLSPQQQEDRLNEFYDHYFSSTSTFSPWSATCVNRLLRSNPDLKTTEEQALNSFRSPQGYGVNFRPYTEQWFHKIGEVMDLDQFLTTKSYNPANRAITVTNLLCRELPTDEPHFYSYKLAGQGYPFDNLQISSIWAGTPVYILGQSKDQNWVLVLTPDFIAWVHHNGIAHADDAFVHRWQQGAKAQLAAITQTNTPIIDSQGIERFSAYVGTVLPVLRVNGSSLDVYVPAADKNGRAILRDATVSTENAKVMPVPATPHQFTSILKTLQNRPYGWGGMYFNNDCSAELKSLYTPFGIWLPRHSSYQVTAGEMVDMSKDTKGQPLSAKQRLHYLIQEGHPLTTIVYIGGHVFMYLGTYENPNSFAHEPMAMTYQDVWGLRPPPTLPNRRAVIGQSVLLPLLLQYPEDPALASLASKDYFQVCFLDQEPLKTTHKSQLLDLKTLISGETQMEHH